MTKTSYRFLHAVKKFRLFPFAIRVLWGEEAPEAFRTFCKTLLHEGVPISFFNMYALADKKNTSLYHQGLYGRVGEDVVFDAGACNVAKLLFLSINGGKDVETNTLLSPITQPLRQKTLDYEEAMGKFQDFLAYAISSYVEMMNIVMYLNETANPHPFRSSLFSSQAFYYVQFGFSHMHEAVSMLSLLRKNEAILIKDKQGWVTSIQCSPDAQNPEDADTYHTVKSHLVRLVTQELRKIPLYKNGNHRVRFYHHDVFSTTEQFPADLFFNDPLDKCFHDSVLTEDANEIETLLSTYFEAGYFQVDISTKPHERMVNGVLYHEKL